MPQISVVLNSDVLCVQVEAIYECWCIRIRLGTTGSNCKPSCEQVLCDHIYGEIHDIPLNMSIYDCNGSHSGEVVKAACLFKPHSGLCHLIHSGQCHLIHLIILSTLIRALSGLNHIIIQIVPKVKNLDHLYKVI